MTTRAMARVATAMAMATKKAMAEATTQAMATAKRVTGFFVAATMGKVEGHGRLRYDWRERDDVGNGPCLCVFFYYVWRDHKK